MNIRSGRDPVRRRRVRKGTHCCRECRRRKVRCTFAGPDEESCISCVRRGAPCVSQWDSDTADLLLTPGLTPVSDIAGSLTEPAAHAKITHALRRAFPSRHDIETLRAKITTVPISCYQSTLKSNSPTWSGSAQEQPVPIPNLLHPESHPVLLAKQMLLFATALQYFSPAAVIPGLQQHHHTIMEGLAESAITLVTTNDSLLSTLEGLENIILEGVYHVDGGNIRRAWLAMRRAVTAAQMLGLHQPDHHRFKQLGTRTDLEPGMMWVCIVYMERMLSLLLGLPTSTAGTNLPVSKAASTSAEDCSLSLLATNLTARILERNQIRSSQQAQETTQEIDQKLIEMSEQLPSTFWQPLAFAGLKVDSLDAYRETRRALDHMAYYTLVNQLHLPYMLCQSHSSDIVYSRVACANASREILTREITIRTFNPITASCRMGDFMALIAGMTLMLAHLASDGQHEMDRLLAHQRLSDRATVEQALQCMRSMSELHADVLAAECAALLKDLLRIEALAAQKHRSGARRSQGTTTQQTDDSISLVVQVPYLGVITIGPAGVTSVPYAERNQAPRSYAGVTLGGIGSIHLRSGASSDQSPDNPGADSPPRETAAPTLPLLPPAFGQGSIIPDVAATIDDWVFQGFDTAFFDVLIRGVGEAE
ncbi:uncharacterized protein BP01DRAFT_408849 [Aspergillus saccharolyticus JOP 1030-1]|uniref:Zn(2)-C6 fungal-type domain-containing protein n=1 Tax=Aspergillus saccharolyticus JOP 1030-1 TaxID=1450539 RepID=A0A318Z7N5_9EURO|nr:hypothetical protein BP01DRAFT_408849 [Aspergillus saccharolyticus JOP 1030-1]PYH40783.1 hypothetical protein BP01DRAFT_408849 [Aspergillus saccharolyticus JOP 1030-1]